MNRTKEIPNRIRDRNVSDLMFPYVQAVLKRDKIPHRFRLKPSGGFILSTALSNRQFTVVFEDALCEKQRDSTLAKLPVYSMRTIFNRPKLERLMKLNKTRGYHVLRCDLAKYRAIRGVD